MSKAWPNAKLGEVLRSVARPVDVKPDEIYREIGIRSHGKGVFHKEPISGLELGSKRVFFVEPGDFVLNIVFAWEGAVALLGERDAGRIGSHRFPTFRADEARLDSRFLLAYFKTPPGLDLLERVSPGGAGRNRTLSKTSFLQQSIPLPPLAEQRRIVARIEEVVGQILEARSLRQKATEEAEVLIASWSKRVFGQSNTGQLDVAPLQSVCSVFIDCDHKTPDYLDEGVPLLRPRDIRPETINISRTVRISREEHEIRCLRHRPSEGDIVYSRELSFGNAAMIFKDCEVSLGQGTMLVRANPARMHPRFLLKVLNAPIVKEQALKAAKGAAHPHINLRDIRLFSVPLPPLPEQRRIVAELDALQAEVDALKRLQAETAAELDALLPAILDKAFKGEL